MRPILPVILCGGGGSRLWPLSREDHPKPLLRLGSEKPLVVETALRVRGSPFLPAVVVCNETQRFTIAAALQQAGVETSAIILEPVGRNTAAAACVAAHYARNPGSGIRYQIPDTRSPIPDPRSPFVLLLPSDHLIGDARAFAEVVASAVNIAASGRLVTFGVVPDGPNPAYGYLRAGDKLPGGTGYAVADFVEKPDARAARRYLDAGGYYWNSGVYLFDPDTLLHEMRAHAPAVDRQAEAAFHAAVADADFLRLDGTAFAAAPDISIDYAVMEKTTSGAVVPASFAWSDLGSWQALWERGERDARGNLFRGDVVGIDTDGTYVHNDADLLAVTIGLKDTVVVVTDDAVLVCDRRQAERVKEAVAALRASGRPEWQARRRRPAAPMERPWGQLRQLAAGPGYRVTEIVIAPAATVSLPDHLHRLDHWVVVEGIAEVTRGDEVRALTVGQTAETATGEAHRIRNPGPDILRLIEVLPADRIQRSDDGL